MITLTLVGQELTLKTETHSASFQTADADELLDIFKELKIDHSTVMAKFEYSQRAIGTIFIEREGQNVLVSTLASPEVVLVGSAVLFKKVLASVGVTDVC